MEWTLLEVLNATKKVVLQQILTHHLCEKGMHFLGPTGINKFPLFQPVPTQHDGCRGSRGPPGGCRGPSLLNALHDEPAPYLEIKIQQTPLVERSSVT